MSQTRWNLQLQESLLGQVKGFWKEDTWDMRRCPVQMRITGKQRRLRFRCTNAFLNSELKYACWKKFSGGGWRTTQEVSKVHRMVKWLTLCIKYRHLS